MSITAGNGNLNAAVAIHTPSKPAINGSGRSVVAQAIGSSVAAGAQQPAGMRMAAATGLDESLLGQLEDARRQQRLLRTILDQIPSCVFVKSKPQDGKGGKFVLLNRAAAAFYAVGGEEALLGKTDHDMFPREMAQRFIEDDEAVVRSGAAILARQETVLTAEGKQAWMLTSKVPLRDESGEIIGLLGISRDITELYEATEALKRSEERMRQQAALLDAAQDAIMVKDLEGRLVFWNARAAKLHGWTAEEVLGRKVEDFLIKDVDQWRRARAELLIKGEWAGEVLKKTKSGGEILVQTRWTLVRDEQGVPKSVLAINTDITDKKRFEQQMLQAQRMESIGTLAGGIAHDLNNILAPILMGVSLLREPMPEHEREEILEMVESSVARGASLVRQVLSFARGAQGERVLVSVGTIAKELSKTLRETFPKSICVEVGAGSGLWSVLADATQLQQVLLNLCVNARDAMPQGGKLSVAVENLMLDEHYCAMNANAKPGPYVMLSVTDTGEGILPEHIERIFDPFFTTKAQGKGTGLGLSTVMGIVKSHQGFAHVYSELRRGTAFKIYFPAHREAAAQAPAPESSAPRGRGETVLVVEDEKSLREAACKTLERFGYRAVAACNGAEAVAYYSQNEAGIHLVITDMMMPIMDGPSTILALRSLNPHVRIIATSGLTSSSDVTEANGSGVARFLAKPYTTESLLNNVASALRDEN